MYHGMIKNHLMPQANNLLVQLGISFLRFCLSYINSLLKPLKNPFLKGYLK